MLTALQFRHLCFSPSSSYLCPASLSDIWAERRWSREYAPAATSQWNRLNCFAKTPDSFSSALQTHIPHYDGGKSWFKSPLSLSRFAPALHPQCLLFNSSGICSLSLDIIWLLHLSQLLPLVNNCPIAMVTHHNRWKKIDKLKKGKSLKQHSNQTMMENSPKTNVINEEDCWKT